MLRVLGPSGYKYLLPYGYLWNSTEDKRTVSVSCSQLKTVNIFTSPYGAECGRNPRSQAGVATRGKRGAWGLRSS